MIGGLKDKTTKFIADGSACFGNKKIHFQQYGDVPYGDVMDKVIVLMNKDNRDGCAERYEEVYNELQRLKGTQKRSCVESIYDCVSSIFGCFTCGTNPCKQS
jgi:hypothetical protein